MTKYFKVTIGTKVMFLGYKPAEIKLCILSKEVQALKIGQVLCTQSATWERLSKTRFALETL